MNSVIILAAGESQRLKSNIPKQFINIKKNKRLLDFSIEAFNNNELVNEIVIVVNKEWVRKIREYYPNYKISAGGLTRSQSSKNGLKKCSKKCSKVLIHDAARPFVDKKIINQCINNLDKYDAVVPVINVSDSVINKKNEYINREEIKLIQTPQSFHYTKIINAYTKHKSGPDDLSVYLKYNPNFNIKLINGSPKNFKITTKNDIKLARELLI